MKDLVCRILRVSPCPSGAWDYTYGVFDADELIAQGISSSERWVRHDAGGYHTKREFDARYPEGWRIKFDFESLA